MSISGRFGYPNTGPLDFPPVLWDTISTIEKRPMNILYFQLQFAAAVHFLNFTGYEIDCDICDLLTSAAYDYTERCKEQDWQGARLALESTLSYVNTELDEDGYEAYIDGFEDCIGLATEGHYDDDIDFENGLFPCDEEEAA